MALRLLLSNRPELTFDRFWRKYPRREAKKDATKAWLQLDPDEALIQTILDALEWQCELWVDREPRFIPLPATYIRGERWTDERPVSARETKRAEANSWIQQVMADRERHEP